MKKIWINLIFWRGLFRFETPQITNIKSCVGKSRTPFSVFRVVYLYVPSTNWNFFSYFWNNFYTTCRTFFKLSKVWTTFKHNVPCIIQIILIFISRWLEKPCFPKLQFIFQVLATLWWHVVQSGTKDILLVLIEYSTNI